MTWYGGSLDFNDRLVFNPYDSTLYRVTVAEDTYDDYGGLYVSSDRNRHAAGCHRPVRRRPDPDVIDDPTVITGGRLNI